MRKILAILVFFALCVCAHAETIVLRTGARVKGTIVFQNDDVVIIRNDEGARFQYPKTDVAEILSDDAVVEEPEQKPAEEQEIQSPKKVSILLEVGAGSAYVPNEKLGAAVNANLLVGSHHIGDRHIFLGGGVGYTGMFLVNPSATSSENVMTKYNFLPIQLAFRIPFLESQHSPVAGIALGYGVALSKDYLGGLYVGADLGYRYQVNRKTAIGAVFFTQFQQAKMLVTEQINGDSYDNYTGRSIVTFGAKFTLYF